EAARIEAYVRRTTERKDEFVSIPFPRIAGLGNAGVRAAIAEYRRQAAIIDARLSYKVSLGDKGVSFADLSAMLKKTTGIDLGADRIVADEKVTIFCKEKPLRDLMRQITALFSFTWRRSGEQNGYTYELTQDLRSQLAEEELRNRDRAEAL